MTDDETLAEFIMREGPFTPNTVLPERLANPTVEDYNQLRMLLRGLHRAAATGAVAEGDDA